MTTQLLTTNKHDLELAARLIRSGGLVAIPTETVYGLGANGLDPEAVKKIFLAKGRPQDNPLILHIHDASQLSDFCREVPESALMLAEAFWPGPLTMILPVADVVPKTTTAGLDTVGVRCPDNDATRTIIRLAGVPIAAPSANVSGKPSTTTAAHVLHDMDGRIDAVVDDGPCRVGVESSIVDLTGPVPRLLRPGGIGPEKLEALLGALEIDRAVTGEIAADAVVRAPGMKYTHYAPVAPLTLIDAPKGKQCAAFCAAVREAAEKGKRPGVIVSREVAEKPSALIPPEHIAVYGNAGDLSAMAARLYECLRSFDDKNADVLFAEAVPEKGLGVALMNRLKKAAGGRIRFID